MLAVRDIWQAAAAEAQAWKADFPTSTRNLLFAIADPAVTFGDIVGDVIDPDRLKGLQGPITKRLAAAPRPGTLRLDPLGRDNSYLVMGPDPAYHGEAFFLAPAAQTTEHLDGLRRFAWDHEIAHAMRRVFTPEGKDDANFDERIADAYASLRHLQKNPDGAAMLDDWAALRAVTAPFDRKHDTQSAVQIAQRWAAKNPDKLAAMTADDLLRRAEKIARKTAYSQDQMRRLGAANFIHTARAQDMPSSVQQAVTMLQEPAPDPFIAARRQDYSDAIATIGKRMGMKDAPVGSILAHAYSVRCDAAKIDRAIAHMAQSAIDRDDPSIRAAKLDAFIKDMPAMPELNGIGDDLLEDLFGKPDPEKDYIALKDASIGDAIKALNKEWPGLGDHAWKDIEQNPSARYDLADPVSRKSFVQKQMRALRDRWARDAQNTPTLSALRAQTAPETPIRAQLSATRRPALQERLVR